MDLQRRLMLYLFGLILGGGLAYWIYGERITNGAWLPEAKVKQRLRSTLLQATPQAQEQMAAWPVALDQVRLAMDSATLDLGKSVRTPDTIFYAIRTTVQGRAADLTIAVLRDFDSDTTATLKKIVPAL